MIVRQANDALASTGRIRMGDFDAAMTGKRKRADIVLVERGEFSSRARAQAAIAAGLVRVGGEILQKASAMIDEDAAIEAQAPHPWASRGGVKLEAALDAFKLDPRGLVCLDIGASTGGFTDVLLARSARRVYAVDVGRDQFDLRLRADPRVALHEGLDARALIPALFETPPEAIVCDVSFMSVSLVLPRVLPLAAKSAWLAALIKPQFEAGRERLKKGAVKDPAVHREVCDAIAACVQSLGWTTLGIVLAADPQAATPRNFCSALVMADALVDLEIAALGHLGEGVAQIAAGAVYVASRAAGRTSARGLRASVRQSRRSSRRALIASRRSAAISANAAVARRSTWMAASMRSGSATLSSAPSRRRAFLPRSRR